MILVCSLTLLASRAYNLFPFGSPYFRLLLSHLKWTRYDQYFLGYIAPPVVFATCSHWSKIFCMCSRLLVGLLLVFDTAIISESSTKAKPHSWSASLDIGHCKVESSPFSWRTWNILELRADQTAGPAPFPWPKPCGAAWNSSYFPPNLQVDILSLAGVC